MSDEQQIRELAQMRRSYDRPELRRSDLRATWQEQFREWLEDAADNGIVEPNAMVLATASAEGRPHSRTVLLKDLEPERLTFYSNYGSAKAADLAENPWCSATFPWIAMGRQVTFTGAVRRGKDDEADRYFASRPYGSQIGAVASPQSERIESREELLRLERAARDRYPEGSAVPRPSHWGGYEIAPSRVEFWQGRPDRLHDRLVYVRTADDGWIVERLAP